MGITDAYYCRSERDEHVQCGDSLSMGILISLSINYATIVSDRRSKDEALKLERLSQAWSYNIRNDQP